MDLKKFFKTKYIKLFAIVIVLILTIGLFFKVSETIRVKGNSSLSKVIEYAIVNDGENVIEGTNGNIEFDAFFIGKNDEGIDEKFRGTCKQIGYEDTLYMELNVLEGTLKNAQIVINDGTESGNIYLQGSIIKDDEIKENVIENSIKTISLNSMSNKSKTITAKVHSGNYTYESKKMEALGNNSENYSKINKITLQGIYVTPTGREIQINKDVEFTVDWYGEVEAQIPEYVYGNIENLNQVKDINTAIDEDYDEFNVNFDFYVQETKNELLIENLNVNMNIPNLNGYKPKYVKVKSPYIDYNYDEEIGNLNINKFNSESKVIDGIDGKNRVNKFKIEIIYPLEAYKSNSFSILQLNIPVESYYECSNNPNEGIIIYNENYTDEDEKYSEIYFENPIVSESVKEILTLTYKGNDFTENKFEIEVRGLNSEKGDISKSRVLDIFNENSVGEIGERYLSIWHGINKNNNSSSKMIMKEGKNEGEQIVDQFVKNNNETQNIDDFTKNVGIYFGNPMLSLGKDGEIRVYDDETNKLIKRFTKDNWNSYSENNPYYYEMPVKHIRIETSSVSQNSSIFVYNIKELDDYKIAQSYTKEEFENIQYIQSILSGYLNNELINISTNKREYIGDVKNNNISNLNLKLLLSEETEFIDSDCAFRLTGKNHENGTISNDDLLFTNLMYDEEYILEEVSLNGDIQEKIYIKDRIVFVITKENKIVIKSGDKDRNLIMELLIYTDLKVLLKEKNTTNPISNATFKLTGSNYEQSKIVKTNSNGEAIFKGLVCNDGYVLEEIDSNEYIKTENISFYISMDRGIVIEKETNDGIIEEEIPSSIVDNVAILNIENVKLEKFNLEINKIIRNENIGLPNVKYKLYCEKEYIGEYVTDETGKIVIENLYEYNAIQNTSGMYTLEEISIPDGYTKSENLKFRVEYRPDGLKFITTSGNVDKQVVDRNNISITLGTNNISTPSFKLVNKDRETGTILAGSKFAIYNVKTTGDEVALDVNYNILGTKEIINGQTYYVLTTNENGEIQANLREGLYKAVQLETLDNRYDLTDNVYYFGIGVSDWKDEKIITVNENDNIKEMKKTSDNGFIGVGTFYNDTIIIGDKVINNTGRSDGFIVKYNSYGEVEWIETAKGEAYDGFNTVLETRDGGYIVSGHSVSQGVQDATVYIGQYKIDTTNDKNFIVKFNNLGDVEWVRLLDDNGKFNIDSILELDDGYIVAGKFSSESINISGISINNKSGKMEGIDTYYNDSIIAKYNKNGEFQWVNSFGGDKSDTISNIINTKDNGIIVCGDIYSTEIEIGENTFFNEPNLNEIYEHFAILVKYNALGNIEWSKSIIGKNDVTITTIKENRDTSIIVGGTFCGTIQINDSILKNEPIEGTYYSDGMIIKMSNNGEFQWAKAIQGDNTESIKKVVELDNEDYIAIGNYNGSYVKIGEFILENEFLKNDLFGEEYEYYPSSVVVIRYDTNGSVKNVQSIKGDADSSIKDVLSTEDGGYVISGISGASNININGIYTIPNIPIINSVIDNEIRNNELDDDIGIEDIEISYNEYDFIAKFNQNDNVECGEFIETTNLELQKYNNNCIAVSTYDNKLLSKELIVPLKTSIKEIYNSINKFRIVTNCNDGGTISGKEKVVYETVKYGENSTKEIKIQPEDGYEIGTITINEEPYSFQLEEDGSVTIPKFENLTEDKKIIVKFVPDEEKLIINVTDETGNKIPKALFAIKDLDYEDIEEIRFITDKEGRAVVQASLGTYEIRSISIPDGYQENYREEYIFEDEDQNTINIRLQKLDKVTVHHYLKDKQGNYTKTKVAEDDIYKAKTGEKYNVQAKLDLKEYELIKDSNNKYIIPNGTNYVSEPAIGEYRGNKEVIFYYEERGTRLIVHHYQAGTDEKAILGDGNLVEDEIYSGHKGQEYSINRIPKYNEADKSRTLAEGYDLVDILGKETGNYGENEIIVYYYYDISKFSITTRVVKHIEITQEGEEIEVKGGTISGEEERPYETVDFGGYSTNEFIITPDFGYEIKYVKINGIDVDYMVDSEGNAELGYIDNIREDKKIEVFFDRMVGSVIVHYYDEETNEKIMEDEEVTGYVGYTYELEPSENIPEYYEKTREEGAVTGVFQKEPQEASFYFRIKNYDYIIEYYYDEQIDESKTETNQAKYGEEITEDTLAEKIQNNLKSGFEFDSSNTNLPLIITEDSQNNIIRIFYTSKEGVDKNKSTYTVKYYYDNILDETKTEKNSAEIGSIIDTYVDKCLEGYELSSTKGLGLVVDKDPEKNIIEIYYIRKDDITDPEDKSNYIIEYYYDDVIDSSRTEIIKALIGSIVTKEIIMDNIEDNLIEGYKWKSVENIPLIVSELEEENIIKVYYTTKQNGDEDDETIPNSTYTIKYYYNEEINQKYTEVINTKVGYIVTQEDIAKSVEEKREEGYKLFSIVNVPLTVTENEDENIIEIYYVTDDGNPDPTDPVNRSTYKIEYYYNETIDNTKTDIVDAKIGDIIEKQDIDEKILRNTITGYEFSRVENIPLTISKITKENIIKVYYIVEAPKEYEYTVEYYYNSELDEERTETKQALYGTKITKEMLQEEIERNTKEGYKFYDIKLIVISDNIENNIVKIYYVKDLTLGYMLEYYYNGIKDTSKTEVREAQIGEVISEYPDKNIEGYKLLTVINFPLTITENMEDNIIKIYYIKDVFGYTLEYYYNGEIDDTKTERIEAEIGENITEEILKEEIQKNEIEGYHFDSAENLPLIVNENQENNTIKIHYATNNSETKTLKYTVEYYKDGEKVEEDTQEKTKEVQAIAPNTLEVNKEEINITNKYVGYKLNRIEQNGETVEVLPNTVATETVIKVYYEKAEYEYVVEYYYNSELDEERTETKQALYGTQITKEMLQEGIERNTKEGYRYYDISKLPIISENKENNKVKVYYIKEVTPGYMLEYYYNGIKDTSKTEVREAQIGEVISEYPDKNIEGYKLLTVINFPLTITENMEDNIIKIYYIKDVFGYTLEYYYNGEIDDTKTERIEAEIGNTITKETLNEKIQKNEIEGYHYDSAENLPLIISENQEDNTIKIHYATNDSETKTLKYTVEYYKDEEKVEEDTQEKTKEVQAIAPNTLEVNKEEINITDKYVGYKLNRIEQNGETVEGLPNTVATGTIIKVYYEIDKEKTKELKYTVEYYKDEEKIEEDTQEKIEIVQVLQSNILEVNKEEINITNKYVGYKLNRIEQNGETVEVLPNTVATETVIKVYYEKAEYEYVVEYYYNSELDEERTETKQALYGTQITKEMLQEGIERNTKEGYRYYDISKLPIISENKENNKVKVYYIKEVTPGYMLEYYYNGIKDTSKTEVREAQIGEVISEYPDKNIEGYKLYTVVNFPLTITENIEDNIIKICYIKDVFGYTVEYYYNGTIDDQKTERIEAQVGDIITIETLNRNIEQNTITGYKYDTAENLPLTINENLENNTIKINYNLLDYYYTVEYYYDGVIDNNKTVTSLSKYGNIITEYPDKNITGYVFEKVEGIPLKITENQRTNVIKVYYTRDIFEYKIEYYFEGELDEELTIIDTALYGEEITECIDKVKPDYRLDRTENLPLVVSENKERNVIKIYYVINYSDIEIKYIDKYSNQELDETIKRQDIVGREYDISDCKKEFDGYTLIEEPETTGIYTQETKTLIYYYAINTKVIVKYLEKDDTLNDNSDNLVLTDENNEPYGYEIEGYEGKEYNTEEKEIQDYTLVAWTQNTSGRMQNTTIEVIYYYAKNTSARVEHIDIKTGEILKQETVHGKAGDIFKTIAENFEGYRLEKAPETPNVIMKKDEVVVVKYYYREISQGVLEKHIDIKTNEILYNKHHEGEPGDKYKIMPREIEGYDLVEDRIPENAEGTMKRELIEVKYYYIRKSKVVVEYIDRKDNSIIEQEEINGYEGEAYNTESKNFEGYILREEPENKNGNMTDETIYVRYYYSHKSVGVIEKHIDVKTDKVLEELRHTGYEGDYYKIEPKEFEGYDLVQEMLPENAEGTMTKEQIEVNYYYIKKSKVIVEYIDQITDKILDKEEIKGHEGDEYNTTDKIIDNYVLVSKPNNSKGTMLRDETIIVKYYYVHIAGRVIEQHIDIKSGKLLEDETIYTGNEGDTYKTSPKEFEEYDLVEEYLPENAEGTMTIQEIVVKYYYIRKAKVKVEYLDFSTKDKLIEDTIISGHEEQEYKTEPKEIEGYELLENMLPKNKTGNMTVETITVTYYYKAIKDESNEPNNPDEPDNPNKPDEPNKPDKPTTPNNPNKPNEPSTPNIPNNNKDNSGNSYHIPNNSNNISNNVNQDNSIKNEDNTGVPYTGDNTPIISIFIILAIIIMNITQLVFNKKNKTKKFVK